jgi:hypothetical protein
LNVLAKVFVHDRGVALGIIDIDSALGHLVQEVWIGHA